jgi:predicted RNA-binding Zn-ribbon protein involved in translation (DUF1610 family)
MDTESEQPVSGRQAPHPCPECGKIVKGGGGLYAHLLLAHNIRRPARTTTYRLENERLRAEIGWKDTEIGNMKGQMASLEQEVTRLRRFSFDDKCKACGFSLEFGHTGERVDLDFKGKKRKGTLFLCDVS